MKNKAGTLIIGIGILCISAAFIILGAEMWRGYRAGNVSREAAEYIMQVIKERKEDELTDTPEEKNENSTDGEYCAMKTVTYNGVEYIGVLGIPSVQKVLPVVSEWSDDAAMSGPCRYSGSVYSADLIIAGHNYTSHFGMLGNLLYGDEVTFTDVGGNVYRYTVAEAEKIEGRDAATMLSSDYELTLFTCTLDGTDRYTVRCTGAR